MKYDNLALRKELVSAIVGLLTRGHNFAGVKIQMSYKCLNQCTRVRDGGD
jgi:hypothetical protein